MAVSIKSVLNRLTPNRIYKKKKSTGDLSNQRHNTGTSMDDLTIFKKAIESLSEGVIITKAEEDNPIIFVNQQFLHETGYTKEEMLGKNPRFLQGPESDPEVIKKVKESIENKVYFRGEIVNYRKNGSCFNNLMTINPILDESGKLTHFVGLQSNVDYRIEMEKTLHLSNQRFDLAVKATKDVIWDWDIQKNIINWQSSLEEVFGYHLQRLESDPEWYFENIHPEDLENVRKKLHASFEKHENYWEDEYRYRNWDGSYKYILDRGFIVYNEKKDAVRMIGAMQDLTNYNQLLNEQITLSRELIHSNKDLQQFGYILSHNLRGSISSIKGLVNVLEIQKFQFPDDIKIILDHLGQVSENLDATISDLVGILQVRSNYSELRQTVYFNEILTQVTTTLQEQIIQSKAEIKADFISLPFITTVKSYLVSILYNLLSNAIKYRSPKRDLIISILTYEEEKCIVLEITDNGMGIDLDQQKEKIFDLYKRFHLHVEGKGMGLYLVKNQVESLGGRIEVSSNVDEGTTFKVYLKKNIK